MTSKGFVSAGMQVQVDLPLLNYRQQDSACSHLLYVLGWFRNSAFTNNEHTSPVPATVLEVAVPRTEREGFRTGQLGIALISSVPGLAREPLVY